MIYTDFKHINLTLPKLVFCIFIIPILSISFISLPVSADNATVRTEIIEIITKESGSKTNQLCITSLIYNENTLSELKGYICIYGQNNELKAIASTNAKVGKNITTTRITGLFDIKEDYIKILVWDKNMIPYSSGKSIPLFSVRHQVTSPSAPGRGGDSVNSPYLMNKSGSE